MDGTRLTERQIRADERAEIVRELMIYADAIEASARKMWPHPRSVKCSEMIGRADQVRKAAVAIA